MEVGFFLLYMKYLIDFTDGKIFVRIDKMFDLQ